MATLLFSAVGASVGSSLLGSTVGTSVAAMAGRAAGGLLGRYIDQRLFGSKTKEKRPSPLTSMSVTTAHQGASVPEFYGRNRSAGHLIWSGGFRSHAQKNGHRYTASFALAVCRGEVHRIGRIWCDDQQVHLDPSSYRFYSGTSDQEPDPLIEKVEGHAPAYRDLCYLVFENFDLTDFGNRIPNLQFEIFRHPKSDILQPKDDLRAVAVIPGSGEYVYATQPVTLYGRDGYRQVANRARKGSKTDFVASLSDLRSDLPKVGSASLIVSWFGDDLRAEHCTVRPCVEQGTTDGDMAWRSGGITRGEAKLVSQKDGRPIYGGTPSDQSVVQSIRAMQGAGLDVMFYPFILMDVPEGNQLPGLNGEGSQPVNPWRGRIGMTNGDRAAAVAKFMGNASYRDFRNDDGKIVYTGAKDWGYRRFIYHYAHLCKLAGGVDEFLIGSELIGLTQMKTPDHRFPFVEALKEIALGVRKILGANVKIGYAADWSEYFGCAPSDEPGAFYFHLDPLWADTNIDFIGIDNYMPLSDWRRGSDHLDASWGSEYSLEYLDANVCGGEGYDWYYQNETARLRQERLPIQDGQGEDWLWRYKDLRGWWGQPHYDRVKGVRASQPTAWKPRSKPIYFTEYGSAAIDLATNQPNKFLDPNSSESQIPHFSSGDADSLIQCQYIRAINSYWANPKNNPYSETYNDRMLNLDKSFFWCWDARPWPEFPGRSDLWGDTGNYARGHWLNGRVNASSLAAVISEICAPLGEDKIDVSKLYGLVVGAAFSGDETIREKLEAMMRAYQFHMFYRNGKLHFVSRGFAKLREVDEAQLICDKTGERVRYRREGVIKPPARFELGYQNANGEYETRQALAMNFEAQMQDRQLYSVSFGFGEDEAKSVAEDLLAQLKTGEERVSFQIESDEAPQVGEYFTWRGDDQTSYLVEEVRRGLVSDVQALAFENRRRSQAVGSVQLAAPKYQSSKPVVKLVDLPFGDISRLAIYVSAKPWIGRAELGLQSASQESFTPLDAVDEAAVIGEIAEDLPEAVANRRQYGAIELRLSPRKFDKENLPGMSFGVVALGEGDRREFVGFDRAETGEHGAKLGPLYRGLYGSTVRLHPKGTPFVLLENDARSVKEDAFFGVDDLALWVAPSGDDLDFSQVIALSKPQLSKAPLAPANLRKVGSELHFSPCYKGDFEDWMEEPKAQPQSYKVQIWRGDRCMHRGQTQLPKYSLAPWQNEPEFEVWVASQTSDGQTSNWIKRNFNVDI